jgi:Ca-activated chloride channel homolog
MLDAYRLILPLAALWIALPATVRGQGPPAPPIKVQVNEVIVPVTVTDDKDRFVIDLDARDFHVYDQGVEQRVEFFSRDHNQPVVVGFLLDVSNTNRLHWKVFQEAAKELVWALLPPDQKDKFSGYLITYGNEAELAVNTTSDSDKITEKIDKLKPGGGAALYDALYLACTSRQLVKGEPYEPRRVIVIIGDGHDTASKKTMREVIELAQRNLVTIFGVSTRAYGFDTDGTGNLTRLAEESGGRVEYPLDTVYKDVSGHLSKPSDDGNYALSVGTGGYAGEIAKSIVRAVGAIVGEVTTQYILRYVPDIGPGSDAQLYRNIKVTVSLENVKIRFRKGYYPFAP